MARRKTAAAASERQDAMPPELRRRPSTAEEIRYWLAQPPLQHESERLTLPEHVTANRRWHHAKHLWRAQNDATYWWYRHRHRGADGAA